MSQTNSTSTGVMSEGARAGAKPLCDCDCNEDCVGAHASVCTICSAGVIRWGDMILKAIPFLKDGRTEKHKCPGMCRNGAKCPNKDTGCTFRHDEKAESKVAVCKFGRKCTRDGCYFQHPDGRAADEGKKKVYRNGSICFTEDCSFDHLSKDDEGTKEKCLCGQQIVTMEKDGKKFHFNSLRDGGQAAVPHGKKWENCSRPKVHKGVKGGKK